MIGSFIDPISVVVISVPLIVACIALRLGAGVHWSLVLRDLGVPLGLLMTFMGFLNIAYSASDASAIAPATAVMLLTILYGGLLASIGYFWSHRLAWSVDALQENKQVKWWAILAPLIFFLAILFWVLGMVNGFEVFIEIAPLGVFTTTALVALIISKKNVVHTLSLSFLLSAMINIVIGLIYFYQGDRLGFGIAIMGVIYSQIAYICLYFLAFKLGGSREIDTPLMNWHWLEVSAFLIFMFLAPITLQEELSNIESEKEAKALNFRIEELERELRALKNYQ